MKQLTTAIALEGAFHGLSKGHCSILTDRLRKWLRILVHNRSLDIERALFLAICEFDHLRGIKANFSSHVRETEARYTSEGGNRDERLRTTD